LRRLEAASGFRGFVLMLIRSIAAHSGHLSVSEDFSWIGSAPAVIAFSCATMLEIGGYRSSTATDSAKVLLF
jgi:hypothetical protein